MDDNVRAAPMNLLLHSLFREIDASLNDTPVSDPNPDYPYRAFIETILNFSEETQKTRLITEGWHKDTAGQMAVTDMAGANIGLKDRATRFAKSVLIELVGRPHLDIFHQSRVLSPGLTLRIKLIPSSNQFVCICPPPAGQNATRAIQGGYPERYVPNSHQKAVRCTGAVNSQAFAREKYQASVFKGPGEAPHYPRERYIAGLRRDFRWGPSRPHCYWPCRRRGFCWPLQPEPFQFSNVQRQSYGDASQWNAHSPIWLHPQFHH